MYKFSFLIFIVFVFSFNLSFANNYIENRVSGYTFRVIKYDTNSKDYNFKIWVNTDYNATSMRELMEKNNWISAINWVFFCPASYRECWWKNFTLNERYFEWEKIWPYLTTWDRVVFAVDKNTKPFLFQTFKINPEREDDIYYWFANFPLLLQDWESKIQDYYDLWLIDYKMKIRINRNFICSDKSGRFIYSWYVSNIELEKLPEVLLDFWCYNALNLDAWWSWAMLYNARHIVWPWRDILDWVVIERKWLDTSKLRDLSNKIIENIDKNLKRSTHKEKLDFLDNLSSELVKIRTKMYNKNSRNLYDLEWNKSWYEINMNSIWNLSNMYIINYLNLLIFNLKQEYIKENENLEKMENLLF